MNTLIRYGKNHLLRIACAILACAFMISLNGIPARAESQAGLPPFDSELSKGSDALLYKASYDPEDAEEDRLDVVVEKSFDGEVVYQYFPDRDATIYEIGFGTFRNSKGENTVAVDKVWTEKNGVEVVAERSEALAPNMFHFRFEVQGKPQDLVPFKLHWAPAAEEPEYANRAVVLKIKDLPQDVGETGKETGSEAGKGTGSETDKETGKETGSAAQKEPGQAIADGVYTCDVRLWNYYENKASMGNAAIISPGKITVEKGKAKMELSTKPITFAGYYGGLTNLFILDGKYVYKDSSNRTAAVGSEAKKFGRKPEEKREYFTKFTFDVPLEAVSKDSDISVVVWVDAMDALQNGEPGAGEQPARLQIRNPKLQTSETPGPATPETPNPEKPEEIPNLPNVPAPEAIAPLDKPQIAVGVIERYAEPGAPSMANNQLDHDVKYQEMGDKTRYEITFKEYRDKLYNDREPSISASRIWIEDGDSIKEAYLAGTKGLDNTFRFELAGKRRAEIPLRIWVVPMENALGKSAAVQKGRLLLSEQTVDGKMVDERYESIPYQVNYVEDKSLPQAAVMVKQDGKKGMKLVYRTYKTINGISTGELLKTEDKLLEQSQDKIIHVGDLKAYTNKTAEFEKQANPPMADGSRNLKARLAVPGMKEIRFYVEPYFEQVVNVKEEGEDTVYTLSFKPFEDGFSAAVKKIFLMVDGKETEVESLGSVEKKGSSEKDTWKENPDRSTTFRFRLPGKIRRQIPIRTLYYDKKPDAILMIGDQESRISREPSTKLEDIAFKTIKKEDRTLAKGETKEVQAGQKGIKSIISYEQTRDGQLTGKRYAGVEAVVIKPAQDRIVLVGTKVKGPEESKNSGTAKQPTDPAAGPAKTVKPTDRKDGPATVKQAQNPAGTPNKPSQENPTQSTKLNEQTTASKAGKSKSGALARTGEGVSIGFLCAALLLATGGTLIVMRRKTKSETR